MAQPSSFQSLGGPLGDKRLEFGSGDVLVGSGADCQVRIEAQGVAPRHARLVISTAGAVIQRLDGPIGINDDLVATEGTLRSGDFVWIGEPGGDTSIMLQFTLGEVEEVASAPTPAVRTSVPPEDPPEEEAAVEEFALVSGEEAVVEEFAVVSEEEAIVEEPIVEEPMAVSPDSGEPVEELVVEESLDEAAVLAPATDTVEPVEIRESDPVVQEADLLQPDEGDLPPEEALIVPEADLDPVGVEVEGLEPDPDPVELEPPPETLDMDAAPPEILETDPVDLDALSDAEAAFDEPLAELPAPAPRPASPSVPPAPWAVPSSTPAPSESPAEYASAWESAPSPPVAEAPPPAVESGEPRRAEPAPPAPVPTPPPAPAPRPSPPPAPKVKVRSAEQDAALRMPPPRPPARTTSSTTAIMGGLAVVVVLGVAALVFLREPAAPLTPAPSPMPAAAATPTFAPTTVPEPAAPVAGAEVAPTVPTPAQAGPAAVAATTPPPRATPPPRTAATPPALPARATPAVGGQPAPVPSSAAPAPAAPASQVPQLLEEARVAAQAGDLQKSSQLFDQVLKLQPGNPEATSRKADVDARAAALAKKFSVSGTTVIGGKAAKGPTGFDLGGGGAVQREYSAQIRCTTTPASVEPGKAYNVSCSVLNIGSKSFKLDSVTVNESADGTRSAGPGLAPRQDIAPQSSVVILQRSGTWGAKSQWSLDILAKTNKEESFRAIYSWR